LRADDEGGRQNDQSKLKKNEIINEFRNSKGENL
jgi:hypothetical protein